MTIDNEGIRKLVSLDSILQTINFLKVSHIIILKIYVEYLNNKKKNKNSLQSFALILC